MEDIQLLKPFPVMLAVMILLIGLPLFGYEKDLAVPNQEFIIDTTVFYPPNASNFPTAWSPNIVFGGNNFLVMWQDWREGAKIYGTRVNQAGKVLDSAGIQISTAEWNPFGPSAAFDENNYLVVWHPGFGALVNQAGNVFDTINLRIVGESHTVAFDGTNYLVVGEHGIPDFYDIYGARVSQLGNVIDTIAIRISTAPNDQGNPCVAFDGTNYLVVWNDVRNDSFTQIYCARVTPEGTVLDTAGICLSEEEGIGSSIAFDGTNYLVVWQDWRNYHTTFTDIYGARVSPDGTVLDTAGIPISNIPNGQYAPTVAFDGENYLVTWKDERGIAAIYGARVNQSGVVIDTAGFLIAPTGIGFMGGAARIAFDGTNYLVVWIDARYGLYNICGSRVTPDAVVLDTGITISTTANFQEYPAAAFDGTNYLTVWQDKREWVNKGSDIYGARISQSGTILDSVSLPISITNYSEYVPSVAFGQNNYFVVWSAWQYSSYDVYGARVTQDGIVLDSNGIAIVTTTDNVWYPSVAFDGTNYLVVWAQGEEPNYWIYGTRINQAGIIIDTNRILISSVSARPWLAISFDGTNYFVVWVGPNLHGARISQSGIVLDPTGIYISEGGYQLSVAFNGTNYLIVWVNYRNSHPYDGNIYGARVSLSGILIDTVKIAIATNINNQDNPSVVFDGANYLVLWEDDYQRDQRGTDIRGARINSAGNIIDTFTAVTQIGNQLSPNPARGFGNQILITYSGWTGVINEKPYNTYRIWGKFYPFVGIEEEHILQSSNLLSLQIYPNPVKSVLRVRCPLSLKEIKIFDVLGKLIKEIASPPKADRNDGVGEVKISLKGINPGIYFLRLGKETKKFLVVR